MKRICVVYLIIILHMASGTAFPFSGERDAYTRLVQSGFSSIKAGDYQGAQKSFEGALGLNEKGFEGRLGLGIAFFHLYEDRYAERELMKATDLDGDSPAPYRFLGELSYRQDDFESALSYWEKAVSFDASDTDLSARLAKLRKEHLAERNFNRDITSHFQVKYEGREKIESGRIVLRILEDAYGEVGRSLSYYPEREIQVILYSARQFQEVTDAPGWSGGIFDGKIRIPIGGIDSETTVLRRLLFHEYSHAVVRAITPRCPTWLNEGLAQYVEGREVDGARGEILRSLARSGKLPSLSSLEDSFFGLDGSQASHAYLISLSSVRYMVDSLGMYRLRAVLDALAAGKDTASAISEGTTLGYEEFERGWKRSLE